MQRVATRRSPASSCQLVAFTTLHSSYRSPHIEASTFISHHFSLPLTVLRSEQAATHQRQTHQARQESSMLPPLYKPPGHKTRRIKKQEKVKRAGIGASRHSQSAHGEAKARCKRVRIKGVWLNQICKRGVFRSRWSIVRSCGSLVSKSHEKSRQAVNAYRTRAEAVERRREMCASTGSGGQVVKRVVKKRKVKDRCWASGLQVCAFIQPGDRSQLV